jgi:hypothetical protein
MRFNDDRELNDEDAILVGIAITAVVLFVVLGVLSWVL